MLVSSWCETSLVFSLKIHKIANHKLFGYENILFLSRRAYRLDHTNALLEDTEKSKCIHLDTSRIVQNKCFARKGNHHHEASTVHHPATVYGR